MSKKKIVLAYSGGLDTSIIVPWLQENYDCEVHAYCGDIGQGDEELRGLEDKARRSGAVSCRVDNLQRTWLTDYVWPCVRAMAVYEGRYLLGTSMARPILAKGQVEYAKAIGATAVAHGCTGKGNDQVRFELAYQTLGPELEVIAPWRHWNIRSREDALDYADQRGIQVTASRTKIYSRDKNLWHISHEGGALEQPGNAPPDDVWTLTVDPRQAPDQPLELTLGFVGGTPVSLNGEPLAAEVLLARLNDLGSKHGVGRVDICENRLVGMKSRGVYETPGGTIVLEAARTLRALTMERDTLRLCEKLMPEYGDLVYTGRWFHPTRVALDALFAQACKPVTGEVRVRLYKGTATALSATSKNSLFSEDLATFGHSAKFDHADSYGFVKLYGLPGAVAAKVQGVPGSFEVSPGSGHASGQMWGGRFQGSLDAFFAQFQNSLTIDHVLGFVDLQVNRTWSRALADVAVFSRDELATVHAAIDDLEALWRRTGVPANDAAEDVHSLVERELVARCGELGKRIHTGRSRNDQVATDVRLYLRERIASLATVITGLCVELVNKADAHHDAPMPGYTHLQRAQPITIGHWALAHCEALGRDRDRLLAAGARMDECPLGSGALAGTVLGVDRDAIANELGFTRGPSHNSLDATAQRDHLCELAFVCAMTQTHLSRLAEDTIFFATQEARFLVFGDQVSTGSSLMPQKRNPDAMELVRGKASRAHGALLALLGSVKGLPLAYNRDLQTDKESLLPTLAETEACLSVATLAIRHATFDTARCAEQAERGYLNATDLADLLVTAGVPFRDAHGIVGAAVNRAVELGVELQQLPAADQRRLLPQLSVDLQQALAARTVLARRNVKGGTAPDRVRAEVTRWRHRLAAWSATTR